MGITYSRCLTVALAALAVVGPACRRETPGAGNPASEGPHQGGQVTIALSRDISSFNQYQFGTEATEREIMDLIFPSFMIEQPDYHLHPPSFAPLLAASWEFSQDNRTLTFHLRRDARWSDGVPVSADDVRFTFRLQKDGRIGYAGHEIKDYIDDVEIIDPLTVRFHFSRVYPYQLMDANDGCIVPAHAWGTIPLEKWHTTDFEPLLVTCGPFRVAGHTRDQALILRRDPTYWENPRPYLDRLVLRIIPEVSNQLSQLLAGGVQVVKSIPPHEAERVRANPNLELVEFPSRAWAFAGWNNYRPLFADRRVRRALTMAINRKAIIDTVYFGHARLGNGPVLSTMWAFNHNLPELPFDQAAARAALAEAGWRDTNNDGILDKNGKPFAFDLLYSATNAIRRDVAALIQSDLAKVGIMARPVATKFTSLVARQESGNFDAVLGAWEEATKIELTSMWSTPSATRGTNNFIGYSNPEVDRLILASREEADYTRAKVLLDRIQELIVQDQPVTFLCEQNRLLGISRHIRGADINAQSTFFNIEEWYWGP